MCKIRILCMTHRNLCVENFLDRIEKLAESPIQGIILREKDLPEDEYQELAKSVLFICKKKKMTCILHNYPKVAMELDHKAIHLPLSILRKMPEADRNYFEILGASCHSLSDVKEASRLGCTYVTAGHVFETDCKKGLPGRGLTFLKEICDAVTIPVYGLGGISEWNIQSVLETGAAGGCIMSGCMKCEDVNAYIKKYRT